MFKQEYWLTFKVGHLSEAQMNALEDALNAAAMKMDLQIDVKKMYLNVHEDEKSQ